MNNYLLVSSGHRFHFPFYFGQMSRDGKAGPFSQCIFNFLRNCGLPTWHFHRYYVRVLLQSEIS